MHRFIILLTCSWMLFGFSENEKFIEDFILYNTNSQKVSLSDYPNAKGFIIVFTCNHCPFAQLYYKRLNALNEKYSKENIPLLAINSMDTFLYEDETLKLMKKKVDKFKFSFPYLQDASQSVGKNFGATHTPQVFLIWKVNNHWQVKYKGAIDNNGEHPELAKSYIAQAIEELKVNKPVSIPEMNSIGCKIMYR